MKNKFHLNKRLTGRHALAGINRQSRSPQAKAVALIDERYLAWLASQNGLSQTVSVQRSAVLPVMSDVLEQSQQDVSLLRAYSYSDRSFAAGVADDLIVRTVPVHAQDGGLGLVRAMGQELLQIAQRAACTFVLIASDDERLMTYIDEAQWHGITVVLLADAKSLDLSQLMGSDPSWARLLAQADRRLALDGVHLKALVGQAEISDLLRPQGFQERLSADEETAAPSGEWRTETSTDWRAQVEAVIQQWWEEEALDARQDLQDEMQFSQGVPAETDRHLLLRVRHALSRPLNFQEKKLMREMIRATVFGESPMEGQRAPD